MPRAGPAFAAAAALLLTGAQPCGLLPGGRLDGEPTPPPGSWSALGERTACQLELRPEDPYSLNVTCEIRDGRLYVASLIAAHKRWAKLVTEDPRVRVRIDGRIYELRAVRVTDAEERRRVLEPDGGEPADGTWVWRLDARTGPADAARSPRRGEPSAARLQSPRRPSPAFS